MDTLILTYNVCPVDRIQLTAEIRKDDGHSELWPSYPKMCSYDELIKLSQKVLSSLREACLIGCDSELAKTTGHLESIRALGMKLRKALLPTEIIERLKAQTSIHHIIFRCDPLLNGVPYGHIYLWDDFLCFSYATGKQLLSQNCPQAVSKPTKDTYRGFSIVDPGSQLVVQMSEDDYEKLKKEWHKFEETRADTFDDKIVFKERTFRSVRKNHVEDAIRNNQFVNFVCHHVYNKEDPAASGYLLESDENGKPGTVFTAKDMIDCLEAGDQRPRLILSVSCESGITRGWEADWPQNDRLHGMVDAVQRVGVPHYVSTLIAMPANGSIPIVLPFYRSITSGQTVGESLRRARLAFRAKESDPLDPGTIMGLAFVLYGNPSTAYFCAEGHCADGVPTVGCAHVLSSGLICGRTVCSKEAGFGHRQCDKHCIEQKITCSAGHEVDNTDKLDVCRVDNCKSTFCKDCVTSAKSLCWFHCSHEGNEINLEIERKICRNSKIIDSKDRNPEDIHENRTIFINDRNGSWWRELCGDCVVALGEVAKKQQKCPHEKAYIDQQNPWFGVCVDPDCGKQTCSKCGPWHEATMYCYNMSRSRNEKDTGWLNYLEEHCQRDSQLASQTRLHEILAVTEQFQANISTNVTERIKYLSLMPRLSLPVLEKIGPQGRVLKVEDGKVDLGNELFKALQERWTLPIDPETRQQWRPPQNSPQNWLTELRQVNQLKLSTIKSTWGSPAILAVSTLTPVEFESKRGPVMLPVDANHVNILKEIIENWWQDGKVGKMPDLYLLVLALNGSATRLKPEYGHGLLTVLAEPCGDSWTVTTPAMEGMPAYVQSFVRLLEPETVYMRMEAVRKWITEYLSIQDFVTIIKAQEEIEKEFSKSVDYHELLDVFKILAETGNYIQYKINGKPALRCATPAEIGKRFFRRRWVEVVATIVGIIGSLAVWQLRPLFLEWLPNNWFSRLIVTILCIVVCHFIGQFLKKLVKYLNKE